MLGKVLDSVLDNRTSATASSNGKKRKKSVRLQNPDEATIHDGENTLYLLSAFLDVLLMKKNIVNRSVHALCQFCLLTSF